MQVEYLTGQRIVQDGAPVQGRGGRYAEQMVADSHARYWDAVMRGNVFTASLQAAATFGTALTATAVTLTLYNPPNFNRYLVVMEGTASVASCTTAGQVVWAVNDAVGQVAPTTVTSLANGIHNCLLGTGAASIAKVYSAATLPAVPSAVRTMFSVPATAATGLSPSLLIDQVDGKLILAPGTMVTLQGITIAGTGLLSIMWEEVVP